MKHTESEAFCTLTAENVMQRNCMIISQHMLIREAARLMHREQTHVAAVVDRTGRCVGMLRAADMFGWIDADCPNVVVGAGLVCPYEVRGRLLNGDEAVICTLTHGSCPLQVEQPTTGGRHTETCERREAAGLPFGAASRYITTDFVGIRPQSSLAEMVQHIVDSRVDELIVLDEFDRPAGIVLATDIVIATADRFLELAEVEKGPITAGKPK
jgi:CBS domain-containing protein